LPRSKAGKGVAGRTSDIIAVASKQLNSTGVSPEWFREIAEELGVSRPMLYKHAQDREDLLLKCYIHSCDTLQAALSAASAGSKSPVDTLETFLTTACAGRESEVAVLCEIDALPDDKQAIVRSRRAAFVAQLAAVVEKGIASRLFRPIDTVVVANAFIGMADWASLRRRWGTRGIHAPSPSGMAEILFRGLAADRTGGLDKPGHLVRPAPASLDPFDRGALAEAKREAVLKAASLLFNRRGIGATRVEDVGAAVGLSKRAVYHYVGQKQALVEACVDRAYSFYIRLMEAAEQLPLSRLAAMFGAIRDAVEASSDPELCILVPYVGYGLLSPDRQAAANAYGDRLGEGYRRILLAGQEEGSVRALSVDGLLGGLPGVFSWVSNSSMTPSPDRALIADELATLATTGILAS
jgi:AcrR family transcriptional regulator